MAKKKLRSEIMSLVYICERLMWLGRLKQGALTYAERISIAHYAQALEKDMLAACAIHYDLPDQPAPPLSH